MDENLRIHIAAVGYDFVRVVDPLIKSKADKAYFILHEFDRGQSKFLNHIKKELKKKLPSIKTKEYYLDIWDLYSCIQKYKEIISKEEGNHVLVNVSTGTKITAIAGMLACMSWNASPYYVKFIHPSESADKTIRREQVFDRDELPVFEINKPSSIHLEILDLIEKSGSKMKKKHLIKALEGIVIPKNDEEGNELSIQAKHSRLRPILSSMEKDWRFVTVEARGGRSYVYLTEQGEQALKIFGS